MYHVDELKAILLRALAALSGNCSNTVKCCFCESVGLLSEKWMARLHRQASDLPIQWYKVHEPISADYNYSRALALVIIIITIIII